MLAQLVYSRKRTLFPREISISLERLKVGPKADVLLPFVFVHLATLAAAELSHLPGKPSVSTFPYSFSLRHESRIALFTLDIVRKTI
jgi:hypothetical protein